MRSLEDLNLEKITADREYFPSPESWEDEILYFLLADRFSDGQEQIAYNPETDFENALRDDRERERWHRCADRWNGGTLAGIKSKLDYLRELGISAIWISPIFRQVAFEESFHGYGIQNFLAVDPHFGSRDDLRELVAAAHQRGIRVVLDIILNHAGNVFAYQDGEPEYNGEHFPIKGFRDRHGDPSLSAESPDFELAWPDGGIWPRELMRPESFSRKGHIVDWENYPEYAEGDFFALKSIHTGTRREDGEFEPSEALAALAACYKFWIADADVDGFRLDTVKHLEFGATRWFAREIHEFARTLGKGNFYILGEITGGFEFAFEAMKKTGLDAALGINRIPEKLEGVAKGRVGAGEFFELFSNSKLLGEDEYKWYRSNVVTMFDDHDMVVQHGDKSRFCADRETAPLLINALFLNLMSPGIPCIYYGTEQGFDGSGDSDRYVREAMFGGGFGAFRTVGRHFFNRGNPVFRELSRMVGIRQELLAIRQGRVYLREIDLGDSHFGWPAPPEGQRYQGMIAWSRILSGEEIVCAINCSLEHEQETRAIIDSGLHRAGDRFECVYCSEHEREGETGETREEQGRILLALRLPAAGCALWRKCRS